MRITSTANPRIRAAAELKERKHRERAGRFLIEGHREIERALAAGVEMLEAYCGEDLSPEEAGVAAELGRRERLSVHELPGPVLKKLSSRDHPAGLIAVAALPRPALAAYRPPADALVLVSVGLEKPGNLGAMLRSADAAGADAVLAAGGADLYGPQVIRNSTGAVFSLPAFAAPEDDVLAWLNTHQIALVATTPHADQAHWDADLRGPVAVVMGAEHEGLSERWLEAARVRVRIPMRGQADSLNVSVTAALMLFEAVRQRGVV